MYHALIDLHFKFVGSIHCLFTFCPLCYLNTEDNSSLYRFNRTFRKTLAQEIQEIEERKVCDSVVVFSVQSNK